jgi:hypothetical protein
VTEGLLLFLVVFTPWAFGTTQTWSIWTATIVGYALGGVLVTKWILRKKHSFNVPRWGEEVVVSEESGEVQAPVRRADLGTRILAVLTVLILGYILVSALNARAAYDRTTHTFEYLDESLRWLPLTYNRGATWFVFGQYLGLACVFWAVRDWLLHRSREDLRENDAAGWSDPQAQVVIPARLRRLLWVLCLNGALLAVVSIVHRASGTNELLWILPSRSDKPAESLFGPWAYRANAASYFNLVWPICLAFWLWAQERAGRALNRRMGRFDGPQLVLLPCAVFAGVCPMISGSRGGAIVSVAAGGLAALMILLISRREVSATVRWVTAGGMALAGLVAMIGGWSVIRERLSRPDTRFATGVESSTNDFTLLFRAPIPARPTGKWQTLVSLGSNARFSSYAYTLHVGMAGNGALVAQLLGSARTNVIRQLATNVVGQFANQEVVVGVVRQQGLRLYANGVELASVEGTRGQAPSWGDYIHTRYLFVSGPEVSEVAMVGYALTPEELAAAAKVPLPRLDTDVLSAKPATQTAASETVPADDEMERALLAEEPVPQESLEPGAAAQETITQEPAATADTQPGGVVAADTQRADAAQPPATGTHPATATEADLAAQPADSLPGADTPVPDTPVPDTTAPDALAAPADPVVAEILLPEGVAIEDTVRPSEPGVVWTSVHRNGTPGRLGFARTLVNLDPRLRGPLQVTFTAWNPAREPLYLGVALDGGSRAYAEVAPATVQTVTVPCRAPHGATPRLVEISMMDELGELVEEANPQAEFFIRDVRLQPGESVFARELVREFRLLELSDRMSGRQEYYENALQMARDYPIWGSGAGTFASIYQLYLKPGQDWAAYLHNDWMETRITLGTVGFSLVIASLAVLLVRSIWGRGLRTMQIVVALWWLALAGCLLHARFDFPFQIYSVLFLFILLCSVLMVLTAARRRV